MISPKEFNELFAEEDFMFEDNKLEILQPTHFELQDNDFMDDCQPRQKKIAFPKLET